MPDRVIISADIKSASHSPITLSALLTFTPLGRQLLYQLSYNRMILTVGSKTAPASL